jgi:putative lipoic acid-binding regulatory protein
VDHVAPTENIASHTSSHHSSKPNFNSTSSDVDNLKLFQRDAVFQKFNDIVFFKGTG